jgi:hypothetical protein
MLAGQIVDKARFAPPPDNGFFGAFNARLPTICPLFIYLAGVQVKRVFFYFSL